MNICEERHTPKYEVTYKELMVVVIIMCGWYVQLVLKIKNALAIKTRFYR